MNKTISTPIAIIIIIVLAVLVGGIVVWQYFGMPDEEIASEEQSQNLEVAEKELLKELGKSLEESAVIFSVDFSTCNIQEMPDAIKNKISEIEDKIAASGGWVKNTVCKIELDDNAITEEYILESNDPGQNNGIFVYKIIEGKWKTILEWSAIGVYIEKGKTGGMYNIVLTSHLSAGESIVYRFEWNSNVKKYELEEDWIESFL